MSHRPKKTESLYEVSVQLDSSKDAALSNDYYLPGQTVSGRVTFAFRSGKEGNSSRTDTSIRSIRLVALGKEQLERGNLTPEMLVDHIYYKRIITLAGMQEREEEKKKAELRTRLETYICKNGSRNPLSGVVLNTHTVAAAARAEDATLAMDGSRRNSIEISDAQQHTYYERANAQPTERERGHKAKDEKGTAGRRASLVHGGELRDDEIMLIEENSVDYPLAFPYSAATRSTPTSAAAAAPAYRLELDRGQTYTFPFAFLLPPWVPPSFHFDRDYVGAMRYTVSVEVVPAAKEAAAPRPVSVAAKHLYVCAAVPKRELLQAHERSNLKPYFSLTQRLRLFPSNALLRFFSKAPKGLLDVRVQFMSSTNIVLRDARDQRVGLLFGCAAQPSAASSGCGAYADPAAGVTVTGAVVSSASLGLTSAASGSSSRVVEPTAPLKALRLRVTVANGGFRSGSGSGTKGEAITKVKVELLEHIKVRAYSSEHVEDDGDEASRAAAYPGSGVDKESFQSLYDYNCPPIRLSKCVLRGNVPYGEQCTFDAELTLPPRFHHGESHFKKIDDTDGSSGGAGGKTKGKLKLGGEGEDDKTSYSIPPPPTNIQTQRVHITTELRVSFPELHTIAEEAAPRNVIVLSEYMDPTDMVPFLPNEFRRVA